MYCNNCGKNNPEGSKFCQHCGIKLDKKRVITPVEDKEKTSIERSISSNTPPYPYVISTAKLIVLSIATFGLYEIYWFYKHWKSLRADRNLKVTPWARALFATIMSYSLFKNVSNAVKDVDKNKGLEAGGLAVAYFILVILWKLPEPYWWLSMLSFLPLIPVQNTLNYYWEKKFGNNLVRSKFGTWNYIWTIIGSILLILALYGTFSTDGSLTGQYGNTTTTSTESAPVDTSNTDNSTSLEATYEQNFMSTCNSTENYMEHAHVSCGICVQTIALVKD